MADNVAIIDGKASFASNREIPWHRLGQIVDGAMTSKEAIELAGLNFKVRKSKVAVMFPDDLKHIRSGTYIKNTYATYRDDTLDIFGVVSDQYKIVQNNEAFGFIDSIIGDGRAIYETAGALGKGEKIFITAKLPYYIKINGHDTIENYLVISNGHDGRSSLNVFLTPIRIVCQNTLTYGMSKARFNVSLRHVGDIMDKMRDAREILEISKDITMEMENTFKHLTNIKVSDTQAKEYFNNLFLTSDELLALAKTDTGYEKLEIISTRKKNILNSVNDYYFTGIGQGEIIGTAYGLYNGVNGYLSNSKKYSSDSKKMESLVLGGGDFKLNERSLNLALSLG